jgi:hypothetical protein
MAEPTSREELKQRILRELGSPVIEINVADEQVEDQIDTALRWYWDYHFSGSDLVYYKHQATANNKADGYITIPEELIGVVRILNYSGIYSSSNMFSIQYQIALNDLYTLLQSSMVPYFSAFQNLGLIQEILVGQKPIRFNRHKNRLYIDADWDRINEGDYLLVEAYEMVDPATYTDAWRDRWLIRYATALTKKVWGNNIKKFSGMQLPGGVEMNGQIIYDEAVQELQDLEAEMINTYSIPTAFWMG